MDLELNSSFILIDGMYVEDDDTPHMCIEISIPNEIECTWTKKHTYAIDSEIPAYHKLRSNFVNQILFVRYFYLTSLFFFPCSLAQDKPNLNRANR